MTTPISLDIAGRTPAAVVWDITYACPLRCEHCYSESGRRPARQLGRDDLLRVTDALLALEPRAIVLAGGEPLLVPDLFEVVRRIVDGGPEVHLYTGGWSLTPDAIAQILASVSKLTVSIDGATPRTHDRLRGRPGSFERSVRSLHTLDDAIDQTCPDREHGPALGVDYTVTRSNFHEVRSFCETVAAGVRHLDYVYFGAVMPIGLGSRKSFASSELLDEPQLDVLRDNGFIEELEALAGGTAIHAGDNLVFQMDPSRLASGMIPAMQVEPDGRVRAMPVYEGTVGSLLDTEPGLLWHRAVKRWNDPFVTDIIDRARTMAQWAEVTRALDLRFGAPEDLVRIRGRPPFEDRQSDTPPPPSGGAGRLGT